MSPPSTSAPSTSAPKKTMGIGIILLIAVVAACPIAVGCVGVLAAVAIPAFRSYMQRAKTAEATTNLGAIAAGLEGYYFEHRTYPTLAPTPASPPCGVAELWAPSDPTWAEIGFQPADPLRYSYEVQGGDTYVIRARGDLDCDGITSLFERSSGSSIVLRQDELE